MPDFNLAGFGGLSDAPSFDSIPMTDAAPIDISTSDLGGFGNVNTDSATSIAAASFNGGYGPQLPTDGPYMPGVNPLALGDSSAGGTSSSTAPQSTSVFGSAASTVKSWYSSVSGWFGGGSPINSSGGTAAVVQPGAQSTLQSRFASLFGTGSPAARGAAPQGATKSSLFLLGGVALLAIAVAHRHR